MTRTFIYFILFLNLSSLSQTTFTNTYNVDTVNNIKYSFDESHSIFEYKNTIYTIGTFEENKENSGVATDGIPDTTHLMLMNYSNKGELLTQNFYTANSCYNNANSFILTNDFLITTGYIYSPKNFCGFYNPDQLPPNVDSVVKRRIFVTSTNLETNEKKQNIIRTGVDSYPFGIVQSNDGNLLIGNVIEKSRVVCLLKINQFGDSLSNKVVFDSIPFDYEPVFLDKTKTGYLIFYKSLSADVSHVDLLNSNGDTIAFKNFNFAPDYISETRDEGYILSTTISGKPKLTKLNKDLNIEWEKTYDLYANSFVKETSDGNFVIGTKDFAKVNKDSIIWKHRYLGPSNTTPWYFIYNAVETSDGGFAITGFYEANTFLIKTDCKGNLIWDSDACKIQEQTIQLIPTVYPNPFENSITFNLPDVTDSIFRIRIMNLLGQILFENDTNEKNFIIDTSVLPQAVYFYSIYQNGTIYSAGKIIKH